MSQFVKFESAVGQGPWGGYQPPFPLPPFYLSICQFESAVARTMRWMPISVGWMAESVLNILSTSTIIKLDDQHIVDKQREIWVIRLSVLYNPSAQALSADPQSKVINIFGIDGFREPNSSTIQGKRCGWLNAVGGRWASHSNHPMEDHHL